MMSIIILSRRRVFLCLFLLQSVCLLCSVDVYGDGSTLVEDIMIQEGMLLVDLNVCCCIKVFCFTSVFCSTSVQCFFALLKSTGCLELSVWGQPFCVLQLPLHQSLG